MPTADLPEPIREVRRLVVPPAEPEQEAQVRARVDMQVAAGAEGANELAQLGLGLGPSALHGPQLGPPLAVPLVEGAVGDDLLVVREHLLEQRLRLGRREEADAGRALVREVRVGAPDVVRQVVLERQPQALSHIRDAGLVADADERDPEVVQRVHLGLDATDLVRDLDRSSGLRDARRVVRHEHPHLGVVAVRQRQLRRRRQLFEPLDRGDDLLLGPPALAVHPVVAAAQPPRV